MMRTKYFGPKLVEAVKNGEVKEEVIDNAAVRIVRTVLAFEDGAPTFDKSVIAGKEHVDLARKVAQEAITLMKNKNNVLPIANSAKTILVIGKLAESDNIGDHGSSRVYPSTTVSPLEGIKEQFSGAKVIFDEGTDPESTKKQAQNADAVVFVVGYNFDDEGEYTSNDQSDEALFDDNGDDAESSTGFAKGGDRRTLNLHQIDIDLINEVGPVNDNSTVILIGGNTILTHAWQDSVSAILNAYYPGMEGGHAIADILSGQVNPSGKLPFAVPADEKYLPSIDWEATEIEYGYLNGYEKLETEKNEIDFAYGSGLSYSTFDISKVEFNRDGDTLIATANVKNTGSKDGAEVIQLYIGYDESTLEHAHKALKGFERVELNAGEEKKVTVTVPLEKLAYFDESKNAFVIEKINYDCYLGNSSLNAESNHAKLAIR
jgi:beta-glucosidase